MSRFGTAWKAFWRILGNAEAAEKWTEAIASPSAVEPAVPTTPAEPVGASGDAVYTLVLLQRHGRLVDFLLEDIDAYSDGEVGAAARQIHAKCRSVLQDNFGVQPVRTEGENDKVVVPEAFDPRQIRISGKPAGDPPFDGVLKHHGWRAERVDFPQRSDKLDPMIICPAEVEV